MNVSLVSVVQLFDLSPQPKCHHCHTIIDGVPAVASTPGGSKTFCRMEPGTNPADTCYNQYRRCR
jgi:hypothetical protein